MDSENALGRIFSYMIPQKNYTQFFHRCENLWLELSEPQPLLLYISQQEKDYFIYLVSHYVSLTLYSSIWVFCSNLGLISKMTALIISFTAIICRIEVNIFIAFNFGAMSVINYFLPSSQDSLNSNYNYQLYLKMQQHTKPRFIMFSVPAYQRRGRQCSCSEDQP